MTSNWQMDPLIQLRNSRIPAEDGDRQTASAAAICARFETQPGVVLADDVGMGKTFVAFAVAASVISASPDRQVVVMVPSAVAQKWPNDWSVFIEECWSPGKDIRVTTETVTRSVDFLKLLDDPAERRKQLIFMTHRALYSKLDDPFVRLALIRQAFKWQRNLVDQHIAFPRWASKILDDRKFEPEVVTRLLSSPPDRWREVWEKYWRSRDDRKPSSILDDDPVPAAVVNALGQIDLQGIRRALSAIPLRSSKNLDRILAEVRASLKEPLGLAWRAALSKPGASLPLLILDEAHHLKNPNQLRSLFDVDTDSASEPSTHAGDLGGALGGMFERMLLLTATPFQLGHAELIKVLKLFRSCRIDEAMKSQFDAKIDSLAVALDRAQLQSSQLDIEWGRLVPTEISGLPSGWWNLPEDELVESVRAVARRAKESIAAMELASEALRPWVIRHSKKRFRSYRPGESTLPTWAPGTDLGAGLGSALFDPEAPSDADRQGLPIASTNVLPFLLAARAHAYVTSGSEEGKRALFADGLASSYEAYLATRTKGGAALDEVGLEVAVSNPDPGLSWYLSQIDRALPNSDEGGRRAHPKIDATVKRVIHHWLEREKVLVFCFYRETGKALRKHLTLAVAQEIAEIARTKYGITGDLESVLHELAERAKMLDLRRNGGRILRTQVRGLGDAAGLQPADAERLSDITLSFMRTSSFLVRYVNLSAQSSADAVQATLEVSDGSGVSFGVRLEAFARRVAKLTEVEREAIWAALEIVDTGERGINALAADAELNEDEVDLRFPDVQLANGATRGEHRHRLMLRFNTPFPPDILVASSVMAEGVDLHLECRHLIHHDLDWSPSTLEQRTGRLDRLGSKSTGVARPILVCEPFVAGTQDEKQFTVVKDRERWFGVVMGGRMPQSEQETDRIAERAQLPEALLEQLTIDLTVHLSV